MVVNQLWHMSAAANSAAGSCSIWLWDRWRHWCHLVMAFNTSREVHVMWWPFRLAQHQSPMMLDSLENVYRHKQMKSSWSISAGT